MRVGFLTHSWPRYEGDVAGAFLERLAHALMARGHSVHVITPSDLGKGGTTVTNRIPVTWVRYAPAASETLAYRGTMLSALRSPAGLLWFANLMVRQAGELRRLVSRERLDVVHAHWWVPGGISAWLTRRPYVLTLHGMDVVVLESSTPARLLAGRILRGAAAITAVSSDLADRIATATGVDRARIAVQPMPIDTSRWTRTSAGGAGVVTVGRMTDRKRLDVLLRALALLRDEGRVLPLTIIGDGTERTRLESLTDELNLRGQVRFTGALPPDDIPGAMGDADVFAFPALGEGFGLAAAEALLLGIPVVAARDGGGVRDIVPESGAGRLINVNPRELANALRDVVDDPQSRPLAAAAGNALRHRLDSAGAAEQFEALYQSVAARHA